MNENNEYLNCFRILLHAMKIFGIFPFLFSHQETSNILMISRIITLLSILCYMYLVINETHYVFTTLQTLLYNFKFKTVIRLLFLLSIRIILMSLPLTTWTKSNDLYTIWHKWQNLQNELESIKQGPLLLPSTKLKFQFIHCFGITISFMSIPFQYYMNYREFSTNAINFHYISVVLVVITTYWFANCLFVEFIVKELQYLISNSIKNQQSIIMTRLMTIWFNLNEWREEFVTAHSLSFLIYLFCIHGNFVASLYFYYYNFVYIFETVQLVELMHLMTMLSTFVIMMIFCESANSLYKQMATQMQEIILMEETANMKSDFLKQLQTFSLFIKVGKPKSMLDGMITLNRSTAVKILAISINYVIILKQFN